jgi:hypothetical protein
MTELHELALKWGTDKAFLYTPVYHKLFNEKRLQVRKVLEFGIGGPDMQVNIDCLGLKWHTNGASIYMWQEYFPNADIYALDFKPELLINEGRIKSFLLDQSDESAYAEVVEKIGDGFDLIIDDGSHFPEHQVLSQRMLVPLLKDSGVYVIEDIPSPIDQNSEWISKQIAHPHELVKFPCERAGGRVTIIVIRKTLVAGQP